MSRFLRFCVEETLAGRASDLKEFTLGLAVFDRPEDFDPRTDPIVRVEARRLRDKLGIYYANEGASDDLLIELPKGGYAPRVTCRRPPVKEQAAAPTAHNNNIRLAVLPFANLGGDTGDYFSQGLAEELIHLLTRIPGLEVIAWESSARFAGGEGNQDALLDRLDLRYYLRGSVRSVAGQVRVSVQLVELPARRYVWSEVYERALDDLLSIESEIARQIASHLQIRFTLPARRAPQPAHGSEEHSLYLMGRFQTNRRTVEGLERAARCYEQALALRPDFALASAALSECFSLLAIYGARAPRDTVPQARAAALRALELDPEEAGAAANTSLALLTGMHDWNWEEGERLYRKALALDPNYATAHYWLATDHLAPLGRYDEAMHHATIACRLDPLSLIINEGPAFINMLHRRYDESLRLYQAAAELDPLFYMVHTSMGRLYAQMGRYEDAIASYQKGRKLAGDAAAKVDGAMGQTLALLGRTDEARALLHRMKEKSHTAFVPATAIAIIHIGLGELEPALDYMEQAVDAHEFSVALANVHPVYDPLRPHARFQNLVRRMRFLP